jgi:hypothetical protein
MYLRARVSRCALRISGVESRRGRHRRGRDDAYRAGLRRGLDACASSRGVFTVLALDHRQNLRRELRPDDPDSVTIDEMAELKRDVCGDWRGVSAACCSIRSSAHRALSQMVRCREVSG